MPHVSVARLSILAAATLAAAPAFAADKIAVVATGLEAQGQLEEVLCVSQSCVATDKVTSGGRVDGKKLDRENVKFTVVAHRAKKGVEVSVRDESGKVRYEEEVEAGAGGKIAVGALVSLAAKVIDSIENDAPEKKVAKADSKSKLSAKARKAALAKAKKEAKKKYALAKANKKKVSRG